MRWLVVAAAMMLAATGRAAPAPGQPRMRPLLAMPGVALPGKVFGTAYCDRARRAIVRIEDGSVLAIDAQGTLANLGNPGVIPAGAAMVCDRQDRVFIATARSLAVVTPDRPPQTTAPGIDADIHHLRVLDDGSLGIVDATGRVYRYQQAVLETRWTTARAPAAPYTLDGRGERIVWIGNARVQVTSATGTVEGPPALAATWLDSTTVAFADRAGVLARWPIDAPPDQTRKIAAMPPHTPGAFVRVAFHQTGRRRLVVSRGFEGPLLVVGFDAQGEVAQQAFSSRIPAGRRAVAVADTGFGIVAVDERAYLVRDPDRPAFVIDHLHPLAAVDALAFSPDGRALALLGGDRDILVAPLSPRVPARRLVAPTALVRPPLRWLADGTLVAGLVGNHTRWNPDGTVEDRRDRAIGFTDLGHPITVDVPRARLAIDRGAHEVLLPIPDRMFRPVRADVIGRYLLLRGGRNAQLRDPSPTPTIAPIITTPHRAIREALVLGPATASPTVLVLDDANILYRNDGSGDRVIETFTAPPLLAVAPDGQRFAVASTKLGIYDARGLLVATLDHRDDARALAWSPDGHTLAVATPDAIELWTFPR